MDEALARIAELYRQLEAIGNNHVQRHSPAYLALQQQIYDLSVAYWRDHPDVPVVEVERPKKKPR